MKRENSNLFLLFIWMKGWLEFMISLKLESSPSQGKSVYGFEVELIS